ncbi:MAG: hypothetical protein K2Q01_01465 [Rickettsiales bacterium]|nr:hypothetical protein [Rickettsiales bacterium]
MSMHRALRTLRKHLSGHPKPQAYSGARHRQAALSAHAMMVAFYIVNLFYAYQTMYTLMDTYGHVLASPLAIHPLWPVFFITDANLPFMANAIALSFMATSLAVTLAPHSRALRALVFLTMLESAALRYSFGGINQKEHWWMWTALLFIFLPGLPAPRLALSRGSRQHFLDIFFIAQGLTLFFYTLSGFWKLYYGFLVLGTPQRGLFSPDVLSYVLARRIFTGHVDPLLGNFFIHHQAIGWATFIWVTYVELVAIIVWFRPALHRQLGVCLIFFHISTWLLMSIPFYLQPPLLAILLIHSPFAQKLPWRESLRQWPGVGLAVKLFIRK